MSASSDSYFSIDHILAEEHPVRSALAHHARGLSYLERSAPPPPDAYPDDTLPRGTVLFLPLWLADALSTKGFLSISIPRIFSPRIRSEMRADPVNLNLAQKSPYFFDLAILFATLVDDADLPRALTEAFATRCWRAADLATTTNPDARQAALRKLDARERKIFFHSHASSVAYARWKERTALRIQSTTLKRAAPLTSNADRRGGPPRTSQPNQRRRLAQAAA